MAATPTTRAQVQAYRFVLRRMEHALVRKDAVMLHDPMRTQVRATVVGLVLGLLGLGGFALLGLFSPRATLGDGDHIVLGKQSLTTYVVREEDGVRVWHPVLNLASARLILGTAEEPTIVDDSAFTRAGVTRGPVLGIPGAPNALPVDAGDRPSAVWTVCDRTDGAGSGGRGPATVPATGPGTVPTDGTATSTSVLVGDVSPAAEGAAQPVGPDQALYVLAPDGTRQLVHDGVRARVDTSAPAVLRELDLAGVAPRPVSAGLLNAIPAGPDLDVPDVPGRGDPSPIAGARVGDVVDVTGAGVRSYYLVSRDGLQEVGPLVAGILVSRTRGYVDIGNDVLAGAGDPQDPVDLTRFPDRAPTVLGASDAPVACLSWNGTEQADGGGAASFAPRLTLLAGAALPLPPGARSVALATGGASPVTGLDGFYLRPGQGAVVAGRGPGQPAGGGTRYLVTDTGTRFGIDTTAAADALGLGGPAAPAPSALLALLPQGPALDEASALRAHNGVAADPGAVQLEVPPAPGG